MKNLTLYLSVMMLMLLSACGSTTNIPREKVNSLLQSGEFTFMAQRAVPTNFDVVNVMNSLPNSSSTRMLQLDYGYTIRLKSNELLVELPYFGRMYTPSYDTSKNSYRFTSKDFSLMQAEGKKGSRIYTISPNDHKEVRRIIMEVFANGKAYVSIDSNDRQPISYDGYIMENTVTP